MRKICRILKENDIGDMGIGAMIVFISMVLVAGIAASVLIQTANKLEIQAMQTGQETTDEVSTGIAVEGITGQKGSIIRGGPAWTNGSLLNLTIGISGRAGSKDIDLSNTVVEISNSSAKFLLKYDGGTWFLVPDGDGVFETHGFGVLSAKEFGIIKLEDADGSCTSTNPVINRGDHVLLTINVNASFDGIPERTDIWGLIIPEAGAPGVFAFRTPTSYPEYVFDLY